MQQEQLIVGSGGREHALARTIALQNPDTQLYVSPGNAGTDEIAHNVPMSSDDSDGIVQWATTHKPDLVIIGPEGPLVNGLSDQLRNTSIQVFGPSQEAAQIEGSKAFAKDFMVRYKIPTGAYGSFTTVSPALRYLHTVDRPVVIKASGLAAGKGVIVPKDDGEAENALRAMLEEGKFGEAGKEVVIEERLAGPELSMMAFTDGHTVIPMVPARDHKRLYDGDQGPNTGGMGAFAPVEVDPHTLAYIHQHILQRAVDSLAKEGRTFSGVLFAGLMLTKDGPKVLEFNCRFGDPETQAVLPLLDTNVLEIMQAVCEGRLQEIKIIWRGGYAVCVVLTSEGYPVKPIINRPIHGLDCRYGDDVIIFHAGTNRVDNQVVTSGGRVLGVAGLGTTVYDAQTRATAAIGQNGVHFDGMQWRRDIGR